MEQLELPGSDGAGQEEEDARVLMARGKIEEWRKEGGAVSNLSRSDLTLLKMFVSAPEEYKRESFFGICDFLDQEEALDHVAAYYEALELGMDTSFNFAFCMALTACNRKTNRSNRVYSILNSLSSFRYITNQSGDKKEKHSGGSERGPLNG